MTDWYYAVDGVQCGPVTPDYLRTLLAENWLERDDMVWNSVVPLMFVQKLANEVNQKAVPLADRNSRIRGWNWLAVIVGVPLTVFIVVAVFMPE